MKAGTIIDVELNEIVPRDEAWLVDGERNVVGVIKGIER